MKGKAALSHTRRSLLTTRSLSSSLRAVPFQLSYYLYSRFALSPCPLASPRFEPDDPTCLTQGFRTNCKPTLHLAATAD